MKRLVAAVAALLVTTACANGSGTGGAAQPTASTPIPAGPESWSPWVDDSPPPMLASTCGSAHLGRNGAVVVDGAPALRCFSAAAKACDPASLSYSELLVDTGTDTTVSLIKGTPCRARYVYDHWSGNGGGSTSSKSADTCTVQVDEQHVDFTCATLTDQIPVG